MSCGVIECSALLSFPLRVDGGVSSNDFVMQLTANLFGRKVARPQHVEMSCLGAAFIAGLGAGRPGSEMHSARPSYRNKFQFHYNQRQPMQ